MLRLFLFAIAATVIAGAAPEPALAQAASSSVASATTPTTRILAVGTLVPGANMELARSTLPGEVRATVQLYLDGKIDQWYSLQDRAGVVFILNVTDVPAAREMLEKLPLGQAHLMTFQLTPIGPLNPLRQLK
jgi:hypothetical protein